METTVKGGHNMVEDRKYEFVLERLNTYAEDHKRLTFSRDKVDLLFQHIDRRLKEIKIGSTVYEVNRTPNNPETTEVHAYGPFNKWTVVDIDYESGMINVKNGNILEKKSILILEPFEEGFELYRPMVKWDYWNRENGCDDFFNSCPEYWRTNNTPISFYASDLLGTHYLVEHNLPNFIVNMEIDPKKREVNITTDAPKKYEKEVLLVIDYFEYYYKEMTKVPRDDGLCELKLTELASYFLSRIRTAFTLRCQSIGDIVSFYIMDSTIYYEKYVFKRNYVFDGNVIKPTKKCYYMSYPMIRIIKEMSFSMLANEDIDEMGEMRRLVGTMLLGKVLTTHSWPGELDEELESKYFWLRNCKKMFWAVYLKLIDFLMESFEKRNATDFVIYKTLMRIKEENS